MAEQLIPATQLAEYVYCSQASYPVSPENGLLIRTPDGIVPVELKKSTKPPARGGIYPNHMIQDAAYCAPVEDQTPNAGARWTGDLCGEYVRRFEYNEVNRLWLNKSLPRFARPALFREPRAIIKCLAVVPVAGWGNSASGPRRNPINGL